MPTFTYKTMVTPQVGPPNNGITFGTDQNGNRMAEPFNHAMPPDKMMGTLPAASLRERLAMRTSHPILSFGGIQADDILLKQTLFDPLAPICALAEKDGWVVLINVDHTVNTSIHCGKTFRAQAIRPLGADAGTHRRMPRLPRRLIRLQRPRRTSPAPHPAHGMEDCAFIQAVPLKHLLEITVDLIKMNPLALLCQREDCERCNAIRNK